MLHSSRRPGRGSVSDGHYVSVENADPSTLKPVYLCFSSPDVECGAGVYNWNRREVVPITALLYTQLNGNILLLSYV